MGNTRPRATKNGVKAMSKKGAPTDSLRSKANSLISGQIVPTKTTKAATARRMLFNTNMLSRLSNEKAPRDVNRSARAAKSISAPPMKSAVIASRKTPRSGSVAKA